MFKQNELVIVKNLGDEKEYRGLIFGKIPLDNSFSNYIIYMLDKIPGQEEFACVSISQSCIVSAICF